MECPFTKRESRCDKAADMAAAITGLAMILDVMNGRKGSPATNGRNRRCNCPDCYRHRRDGSVPYFRPK